MYKIGMPNYDNDPDWTVTLSQIDFPWKNVKFGEFSALDCYQKYKSEITDEFLFN